MARPTLSIFDIPLVVDLICDYLGPLDYEQCQHVCRTWNVAFKQYTWRTVSFLRKCESYTGYAQHIIPPHQQFKIRRHANLVHSLETSLAPEMEFLTNFSWSQLRNLKVLNHWIPVPSGEREKRGQYFAQLAKTMAKLLDRCPRLSSLAMSEFDRDYGYCSMDSLMTALPGLCSLTLLSFHETMSQHLRGLFQGLLEFCPESLVELRITLFQDGRRSFQGPAFWPRARHFHPRRQLPLRKVALASEMYYGEDVTDYQCLATFLEHCPELVDLSLPFINEPEIAGSVVSTLIRCCPRIQRFDLKCPQEWIEHTMRLLKAYPGLKAFSFLQGRPFHCTVILDALLAHSAHTLETLSIFNEGYFKSLDMYRILCGFPRLQSLAIRSESFQMTGRYADRTEKQDQFTIVDLVNGPNDPSVASLGDSHGSSIDGHWQWACQDLESLCIPIMFSRDTFTGHNQFTPVPPKLTFESSLLAIQFLEVLLSLPKLKDLDLEWNWPWYGSKSDMPSSCIHGLFGLFQKDKEMAKRLDVDWINQETLDWVGVDTIYMRDMDDVEFYHDDDYGHFWMFEYGYGWYEWYGWNEDPEDPEYYGIPVLDRNKYHKTGKSQHRRRMRRREGRRQKRIK